MIKDNFNINPSPSDMKERDDVLLSAFNNLIYFGRAFLPRDFLNKSESAPFHYDMAKKMIDMKPVAWVAEEQGQAIDHLKYIRSHFENNKMIKYYFGNMDGGLAGKRWTEKDLVTPKGDRVIAKGTSQRLRGRSEVDVRYTGIVLDDFESELNTKTPERRSEIKKWIVSTVFPALEETPYDGWKKAKEDKRTYPWDVNFYRALEGDEPLWKSQFSKKKLNAKKREFIEAGLVNKFAQEYMNDARDITNAAFKIDRIQYYNGRFEREVICRSLLKVKMQFLLMCILVLT